VKPASFAYHRPGTVEEALSVLAQNGSEAKPLAGGQSLIPAMNFRLARPSVLVDLNRIEEMAYVRGADGRTVGRSDGQLHIGAMTRQSVAERDASIAEWAPLLKETMPFIAHPQIRNRGTIGGSLAHADPAAELPSVMVALGATFQLRGPKGSRSILAEEFYTDLFATALQPGELLVDIAIPRMAPHTGWAFLEVSRRHGDYALAGVAALVSLDDKGKCREARIALLSVGDGPVLAKKAINALKGEKPGAKVIAEAAEAAGAKDIDPPGDMHASAAYRRQLTTVLTRRALEKAFQRAVPG
jgi:carbon-monoxide dehydrogenase medium subunit